MARFFWMNWVISPRRLYMEELCQSNLSLFNSFSPVYRSSLGGQHLRECLPSRRAWQVSGTPLWGTPGLSFSLPVCYSNSLCFQPSVNISTSSPSLSTFSFFLLFASLSPGPSLITHPSIFSLLGSSQQIQRIWHVWVEGEEKRKGMKESWKTGPHSIGEDFGCIPWGHTNEESFALPNQPSQPTFIVTFLSFHDISPPFRKRRSNYGRKYSFSLLSLDDGAPFWQTA